ncbi:elongation factor P [Rhizobiaceae bacterium]|nr:elongation factor P [Rhizobiaceae bacterium]
MKVQGNQIRPGNIIEHKDRIWRVVKTQAVATGKSGAYAQVEMKDVVSGTKLNERFRASESLEKVRLEQRDATYLYAEGDDLVFMDSENYEQTHIKADMLGDQAAYLTDGMAVKIERHDEMPISVEIPSQIEAEIVETAPAMKGATATSSYKPAVLDNGVRVMVPDFIKEGDRISVDTSESTYLKRV